jgi:SPOR domain
MKQVEENTDALAELLRQKNILAFMIKHDTGRSYRVAVGPYSSNDSGQRVGAELRDQGFDVIRKQRNTPALDAMRLESVLTPHPGQHHVTDVQMRSELARAPVRGSCRRTPRRLQNPKCRL